MGVAMATSKLTITSLLLGVHSALKEHPANIGKEQFALWQLALFPQGDGEARPASVNGVDFTRLWQTLEGREWTF
jgi:hypothetical protein